MYTDITLKCKDCGADFVFTAGEQEFYAEKGFTNQPQRCKACRDAKKNAGKSGRTFYEATCAGCGGIARVPFEPKEDRPVYCQRLLRKDERRVIDPPGLVGIFSQKLAFTQTAP